MIIKRKVFRLSITQPKNSNTRYIPLTQGKVAIVSRRDYLWLIQWNWFAWRDPLTGSFYAARNGQGKERGLTIHMHVAILNPPKGKEGDHKSRNTLDNRRRNLRIVSHSQNHMNQGRQKNNKSGFPGIYWDNSRNMWAVEIIANKIKYRLGRFLLKREAIETRKRAEEKLFGKYRPVL